ncbi:MAG: FmdB family zinc ribbon protein [Dethiobacteria bacterium]
MPIYEFRCECGHQFEKLCKVNEQRSSYPCPECEGEARRVMSTFRKMGSSTSFGESCSAGSCSSCSGGSCSSCH